MSNFVRFMKKFYQSLFFKILMIAGFFIMAFALVRSLFFLEEGFYQNVIYGIWLLLVVLYFLDIYVFQKKKRSNIIMYFIIFMQIMLSIISQNV